MSRERPANTKQTAKQGSPMPTKGNMKTVNATNPTLHTGTAANVSTKTQGGKGNTQGSKGGKTGTQTGSGSTSSISLGQSRFDSNAHMLYADAKKGGIQIRCSITEDALCECFDVEATSTELQSAFTEHKGEILKALEQKWLAGDWKTPNKEICLEETDIRRVIK
jgi:hypothetical protein